MLTVIPRSALVTLTANYYSGRPAYLAAWLSASAQRNSERPSIFPWTRPPSYPRTVFVLLI